MGRRLLQSRIVKSSSLNGSAFGLRRFRCGTFYSLFENTASQYFLTLGLFMFFVFFVFLCVFMFLGVFVF
jgi:hypothetical protein